MSNQFVQLKDNENNLFPKSLLIGIDVNNVLVTHNGSPYTYVATEDCVIITVPTAGNYYALTINDAIVGGQMPSQSESASTITLVKKGQTYKTSFPAQCTVIYVYGVKYI